MLILQSVTAAAFGIAITVFGHSPLTWQYWLMLILFFFYGILSYTEGRGER